MNVLIDGEIVLTGTVGKDFWMEGFTYLEVFNALVSLGRNSDVTVRINSGGGYATEGAAIYSLLKAHGGTVSVIVEGIAASAASVIAMAGDTVTMVTGSVMMIHDPSAITFGTADDHEKSVEMLDAIASSLADAYADKTGRSAEQTRADMREELWLTPQEAIDLGYADAAAEPEAEPAAIAAFNYRIYQHAPERIVALADARGWSKHKVGAKAARPAPTHRRKENSMPKDNQAGGAPARTETIAADQIAEASARARNDGEADGIKKGAETARADAAEIVEMCAAAGVSAMAPALIKQGLSVADAKAKIEDGKQIRAKVEAARKRFPAIAADQADRYIAAGLSAAEVSADLFDKMTALQSPEITAGHQAAGGQAELPAKVPNAGEIYATRAKARAERAPI